MTYLKLITPTNIPEEKKKFFRLKAYSPQFTYTWNEQLITKVISDNPRFTDLARALVSQESVQICALAANYFDVEYRPNDIAFAKKLIAKVPHESNGTAIDVAQEITQKLAEFDIDYKVEIVDMHGFQCRPDHKHKVLRISKYLHLQFYETAGIAIHELVHIIRAVNGAHAGITPAADYLPTEEGLACLIQDHFFKNASGSTFQHALEYLASHKALTGSFRDVYDFFRDHGCNENNAWLRSIRQKFGFCDTSLPGTLMKSGMYFYHERLLLEKSDEEILRQFVGKIPLNKLHEFPTYDGIIPKDKIEALYALGSSKSG